MLAETGDFLRRWCKETNSRGTFLMKYSSFQFWPNAFAIIIFGTFESLNIIEIRVEMK